MSLPTSIDVPSIRVRQILPTKFEVLTNPGNPSGAPCGQMKPQRGAIAAVMTGNRFPTKFDVIRLTPLLAYPTVLVFPTECDPLLPTRFDVILPTKFGTGGIGHPTAISRALDTGPYALDAGI